MASIGSGRFPKMCRHKATGQAVVRLNGRDFYLGQYKSGEARAKYDRLIAEWIANGRQWPQEPRLSVNDLIIRYWRYCEGYYRKPDGTATSELDAIRSALKPVKILYGKSLADEFGPLALKAVQSRMVDSGASRTTINSYIGRVRRMFHWAVANELLVETVYRALQTVEPLKSGRCDARESAPVKPVSEAFIEAVLAHCSPQVATMIRFQQLTGCRPGEVCRLRPADIDMSGETWVYQPIEHKTAHRGLTRKVFIGQRSQDLLKPWLNRQPDEYLFSPREANHARNAARRAARKSRITPSQTARRLKERPGRPAHDRYSTDSYRRAIHRACAAAFPAPDGLSDKERERWRLDHQWFPNKLRHTAATKFRSDFGVEAAQVLLGHQNAETTQIYAERNEKLAARIAREVG